MIDNFFGLVVFIVSLGLMFLIVPWHRIRELLTLGLVGGFILAFLLIYLMQNLLGFWVYQNVDILYAIEIPLLLSAAWTPLIIIYSELLTRHRDVLNKLSLIVLFPLGAALLHYFMLNTDLLSYNNWSLSLTFLVSLLIHAGIAGYLYAIGHLNQEKL